MYVSEGGIDYNMSILQTISRITVIKRNGIGETQVDLDRVTTPLPSIDFGEIW